MRKATRGFVGASILSLVFMAPASTANAGWLSDLISYFQARASTPEFVVGDDDDVAGIPNDRPVGAVPEPTSAVLFAAGGLAIASTVRRRRS